MKKLFKIIGIVLGILVIGYFVLDYVANSKLKGFLDEEKEKGSLSYSSSSVNLISGSAAVKGLDYYRATDTIRTDNASAEGFSIYDFLINDQLSLDRILVEKPIISLRKQPKKKKKKKGKKSKKTKFKRTVLIDKIEIKNGKFQKHSGDTLKFKVKDFTINFKGIEVSKQTLTEKIPFNYKAYQVNAQNIFVNLGKLEELKIQNLNMDQNSVEVDKIRMDSKLTRDEYITKIPYEKDLIDIKVKNLNISGYNFEYEGKKPKFRAKKIKFFDVNLDIYRDKTVKDDPRKKKLYSRMIRELPMQLEVDSLIMDKAKITYEERIKKGRRPGKVFFENTVIKMTDISNKNLERHDFPKTKINISTVFMGTSKLNVNWSFKINDEQDQFKISGQSSAIPPRAMNPFFVPALNVKADGTIDALYFNFIGNQNMAEGDFKMVYESFQVKVLRKNSNEKNGFLSFVANIFVNNDNDGSKKSVHVSNIKRDKTKSFWNYFWKCVQAGLKKTLI